MIHTEEYIKKMYNKKYCKACPNHFYTPKKPGRTKAATILRPITSQTCSGECSKKYQIINRRKYSKQQVIKRRMERLNANK